MLYVSHITITAGTAIASPLEEEIHVNDRIVKGAVLIFSGGSLNVGARLLDRSMPFAPAVGSAEQWIRDNGQPIDLPFTRYRLQHEPWKITVQAFNTTGGDIELEVYLDVEQFDYDELILEELKGIRSDLAVPIPAEVLERARQS